MLGGWWWREKTKHKPEAAAQTLRAEEEAGRGTPGARAESSAACGRGHGGASVHTTAPQAGEYFLKDISCGEPTLQQCDEEGAAERCC